MADRPRRYSGDRVGRTIRLPRDLADRLAAVADERCVSANLIVAKAVEHYLAELERLDARIAQAHDPQGRTPNG